MIEKLKTKTTEKDGGAFGIIIERRLATEEEMQEKINELVDAVNKLQEAFESIHPYLKYKDLNKRQAEPEYKNRNVKQAEKWMYCLCRFWNDGCDSYYGELVNIDTKVSSDAPFERDTGDWYQCCEPVKPDDDIIYKGE